MVDGTTTRSPGRRFLTSLPTSSTTPTASWPRIVPDFMPDSVPRMKCRSVPQMALAVMPMSASEGECVDIVKNQPSPRLSLRLAGIKLKRANEECSAPRATSMTDAKKIFQRCVRAKIFSDGLLSNSVLRTQFSLRAQNAPPIDDRERGERAAADEHVAAHDGRRRPAVLVQ